MLTILWRLAVAGPTNAVTAFILNIHLPTAMTPATANRHALRSSPWKGKPIMERRQKIVSDFSKFPMGRKLDASAENDQAL